MTSTSTPKRFILLGDAGAGKSAFINLLYNCFYGTKVPDEIFCDHPKLKLAIPCANWLDCLDQQYKNKHSERDINDQTQSQTQKCATYTFRTENIHLEVIDTPGFNDTNGTDIDERNLTFIEQALKELPFLSGIIIVVNGALPRLGVSFKNFLHLLHQVWPNDLLNNCIAVLTNCDELSVNLDPSVLQHDLNVDKTRTFHVQNSLFRWDRKNQSDRTIRRFREDFEDNWETIKKLVKLLLQFNDVSTKAFEIGAVKILVIEKCVFRSVQNMVDLLNAYKEQHIAQEGIDGARHTMQSNKEWEKHREINAIRWMEVPRHRSPSPPQLQQKYTRQSFFAGEGTTSSQMSSSSSKDRVLRSSQSYDGSQEPSHSYPTSYGCLPSKANSTFSDDEKRSKQTTHIGSSSHQCDSGKRSSPKPTTSQKAITYSSAYDSSSHTKQPTKPFSSHADISHSKTVTSGKYDKSTSSASYSDSNRQQGAYSTTSASGYSYGNIGSSHNNTSSSYGPVYQQTPTKVQVTIPDNEARSHYDYAQRQELALQERTQDLKHEQHVLSGKIASLLQVLKEQVAELRSINKNYDIIERNRDLLIAFKETIKYMGDSSEMTRYYDETVNILSKK